MEKKFVFSDMNPELQTYLDYRGEYVDDYETFREKSGQFEKLIQEGLLNKYESEYMIWTCRDETSKGNPHIKKSPTGKYELHVTLHETEPGCWGYSKGKIYEGDRLIAEVCRNYSSFPHLFVENHPKGDFLITGSDYQGQTIIELSTGRHRDNLSKGADEGHGFCWAEYEFNEENLILTVDGCVWACPYEFRFFDFSDPMTGWPEIEIEPSGCVYTDGKKPTIVDGVLKVFQTESNDDDDEDEVNPIKPGVERFTKTYRREGNKFIFVEEWVSEAEKERRIKRNEDERIYEEETEKFKLIDPLYLAYKSRLEDSGLNPSDYESIGITYENWCPDFKGNERRWCRRILNRKGKIGYTIDLEWAVETGPIKLVIYKDGNSFKTEFFPHSVGGMNASFDAAKIYATSS